MTVRTIAAIANREDGHTGTLPGLVVGAAGAILLGIGAANDTGWLAIVGGIVAAIGMLATDVLRHVKVDYSVFRRLEDLENKK
jgi:uncharacterized membrane protein YebE (DUF533 family)